MKCGHSPLLSSLFLSALALAGNICAAGQSSPAAQQSPKGTIAVVKGSFENSHAVNSATVRIHSLKLEVDLIAMVESLSRVTFQHLPPDNYRIVVTAPGYEAAQLDVSLSAGQNWEIFLFEGLQWPPQSTPSGDGGEETTPLALLANLIPAKSEESPTASLSSGTCPIENVLPRVTSHIKEFVESVNRFSATEVLEYEQVNQHGKLKDKAHSKSNYVVMIQESEPGSLTVEEYRDGTQGLSTFPGNIAIIGAPALALIFHPSHIQEFDVKCEGLKDWHGHRAWQLQFQQRMDQPATMSRIRYGKDSLTVLLKGFAWIDSENYQIVHLETDLLQPIPEIKFDVEHQSLDYGPVAFAERGGSLWLPQVAEITLNFGGKRFMERHTYTNYRLFSIDTGQKIGTPKDLPN